MKFRNRETGEIIEVTLLNDRGDFAEILGVDGSIKHLTKGNLHYNFERLQDDSINWEQRRYEIAKDMMRTIYLDEGQEERCGKSDIPFEYKDMNSCAREAVEWADVLIKELKRPKGNDGRKKIDVAATALTKETWNHEEGKFSCMDDCKVGVKRMWQEFAKQLWHDAREEPCEERFLVGYDSTGYCIYWWGHQEKTWKEFADNCELKKWLYIDDVLPKEGGRNDDVEVS